MRRSTSLIALLGGGLVIAGCMVDDDGVIDEPTSAVEQAAFGCPLWLCNAATLNIAFHELNENGLPNKEGFRLMGLWKFGLEYKVDVNNTQIKATRVGSPTLSGMGVKNAVIKVKHESGVVYNLYIDNVHTAVPYWPNVGGGGTTFAYEIRYTVEGADPDRRTPICNNAEDVTGEYYETLGQPKWSVVLHEGDRWDATSKDIVGFSKEWFNVGCAGHVLGKIHMAHRSYPGSLIPTYGNSLAEREAMVNMYISNVCGDGTSFTVDGTKLSWSDNHVPAWSPHQYFIPTLGLEARWDDKGAVCLEKHRLVGTADPDAIAEFGPDIDAAIDAHCGARRPKKCSDLGQSTDVTKLEGAFFVSATPP